MTRTAVGPGSAEARVRSEVPLCSFARFPRIVVGFSVHSRSHHISLFAPATTRTRRQKIHSTVFCPTLHHSAPVELELCCFGAQPAHTARSPDRFRPSFGPEKPSAFSPNPYLLYLSFLFRHFHSVLTLISSRSCTYA